PTGAVFPVALVQAGGGIDMVQAYDWGGTPPGSFNMPNLSSTDWLWNSSEQLSQAFNYTPPSVGTKSLLFNDRLELPQASFSFNASVDTTSPARRWFPGLGRRHR